jgi:cell wall-associated NlpC family hydrolase
MLRLLAVVSFAASVAACASSGVVYTPKPFPTPGGGGPVTIAAPVPAPTPAPEAPTAPATAVAVPADGYALSGTALSLRGAPYRVGGIDPATGFDCSGFVRYVYQQHGVPMPREVREQFRVGKTVDRDRLEPGDLVFFSTVAPGASHVGIVIGGDQFVHAPSERGVVRVETLNSQYWSTRYIGAKRVS